VCCTIRGDLVNTLHELLDKVRDGKLNLDGVLIELTGAADPAPVVQSFMVDEYCRKGFKIDNVITLFDAKHGLEKLDENQGTPHAQIAFSSTVLLNKIDLVDAAALEAIEKRIKQINSIVEIIRCEHGRVDMSKLLGVGAFDLERVLEEQYMDEEEFTAFYTPKMDNTISNVGVRCDGAINMFALQMFINKYLEPEETAKEFMRVKGVFNIMGGDKMFVMQCVHMLREQRFTRDWKPDESRENRIIFIGRNMQQRRQELRDGFLACAAKPLRFAVDERVLCRRQEGYVEARVLKHWDEHRAYRLELQDTERTNVWGPIDNDNFIKRKKRSGRGGGYKK